MVIKKDWQALEPASLKRIKGQLGVFELGNESGEILYIGAADARSLFGLKGVLEENLGTAANFRCEVTTMYSTRRQELLICLLYTSPSPRDQRGSRMPSSA